MGGPAVIVDLAHTPRDTARDIDPDLCLPSCGTQMAAAGNALCLTLGTRLPDDRIHYPDHDLITHKTGPARRYLHGDGTEYRRKT